MRYMVTAVAEQYPAQTAVCLSRQQYESYRRQNSNF